MVEGTLIFRGFFSFKNNQLTLKPCIHGWIKTTYNQLLSVIQLCNTAPFRPLLLFTRIQLHAVGWILHNCFALLLHATKQILVCRKSIMKFILKATTLHCLFLSIRFEKNISCPCILSFILLLSTTILKVLNGSSMILLFSLYFLWL